MTKLHVNVGWLIVHWLSAVCAGISLGLLIGGEGLIAAVLLVVWVLNTVLTYILAYEWHEREGV